MTGEDTTEGTGASIAKWEKEGRGLWWILFAIIVIIILLAAAYLTIGVVISEAPPASSYPYTTTYQVFLPNSQVVTIGNTEIIAIPTGSGDQVTLSINGQRSDMNIGQTKTIQERKATITALTATVMDFDFRVDATYKGTSGDTSQFYIAFGTSRQVPSFLIERLLPPSVQARPV